MENYSEHCVNQEPTLEFMREWSTADVKAKFKKILGENLLRVMKQCEQVAKEMQAAK